MLTTDAMSLVRIFRHLCHGALGLLLLVSTAVAEEVPEQPDEAARQLIHDAVQRITDLPDPQEGRAELLSQVPEELNDLVVTDGVDLSSPPPPFSTGEEYSGELVTSRGGVACLGRLARLTVECAVRGNRKDFADLFNVVSEGQAGCLATTSNIGPDPLKPFTATLSCRRDTCPRGQACRIIPEDPSFVRNRVIDKRQVCPITFDEFTYLGECR